MMDQLPCGSVLTPAISCTKLKIYLAHADSPMAKIVFISLFLERTSLCFTHQEAQEENEHGGPTLLWVSAYTSYFLCKAQDPFSTYTQFHSQNTFSFFFIFLGGPVFASQTRKLRKRTCLVDQLPCGSVLTLAISCTKFKIHSGHADSPMAKTVFVSLFLGRTSLCFTDQETLEDNVNSGETPLWFSS